MPVEMPTKDDVIKDLIAFFQDSFADDPAHVEDWIIQGDWSTDDFIAAVAKLKRELTLRD